MGKVSKLLKIDKWTPKSSQCIVEPDNKIFLCHFDRVFQQPKLERYNKFYIQKLSYINNLELITKYINYFINCYDSDNELISAYLKIKFETDEKRSFTENNMEAYISFLYEILFTDTIINKINMLVDDNYLFDIEGNDSKKKKYQKNDRKHLESLEFTNQHVKILLRISFAMKLMAPCMLHYHAINSMKLEKDSDNIYKFYKPLFDIFGLVEKHTDEAYIENDSNYFYVYNTATEYYDKYDFHNKRLVMCSISNDVINKLLYEDGNIYVGSTNYIAEYNLYNKLYVYVKTKVNESYSNNSPIFEQQEIFGIDLYSKIQDFVRRVLISENVIKYKFNNNIIGFNKTIIKYQLTYFLKEQYEKNLAEITNAKNGDGLSGGDKMMMNLSKIDEGITIMADINIPITLDYLCKRYNTVISDEEIEFYIKNHHPDDIQIQLVLSYFAKYFGSYRDLNLLRRRDYIVLMLILKKKLINELGYSDEEDDELRSMALPYIISGNSVDHINTRVIRNIKFTEKVQESYTFQKLQEDNHKYLNVIKPNYDMKIISSLINTKYTYVEFHNPELLDKEIVYSDDKISDEILFFLASI